MNSRAPLEERYEPDYGHGGVPWFLLCFYLAFLVFFTWYTLEYQVPDFLAQTQAEESTEPALEEGDAQQR